MSYHLEGSRRTVEEVGSEQVRTVEALQESLNAREAQLADFKSQLADITSQLQRSLQETQQLSSAHAEDKAEWAKREKGLQGKIDV